MAYIVISYEGEEIQRQNLKGAVLVGRALECDISVHDFLMSRKHCRLQCSKGQWTIVDLSSRNGTFVNDKRIEKQVLNDGDLLRVGNTLIEFHVGLAPALRPTGRRKSNRPLDPIEALAGTVFAYEMPNTDGPPRMPMLAGRPMPRPAPAAPPAYERENVHSMVVEMLSDLHDSLMSQNRRSAPRLRPRPLVGTPGLDPSPASEAGSAIPSPALDVVPSPGALEMLATVVVARSSGGVATLPAPARTKPIASAPAPTVRKVVKARKHPRPVSPAAPAPSATAPARRRRVAALDVGMVFLLASLLAIVVLATRALFLLA